MKPLPGFDVSDPSVLFVSLRELNLFQLCDNTCLRYLGVVKVYNIGLIAAFNGKTNTTSQAYRSSINAMKGYNKCLYIYMFVFKIYQICRS